MEALIHLHQTVSQIKELGLKAGVSLNPATPLSFVESILTDIDLLLIMTVNPGFGGQQFIKTMLSKIRQARELIDRFALIHLLARMFHPMFLHWLELAPQAAKAAFSAAPRTA